MIKVTRNLTVVWISVFLGHKYSKVIPWNPAVFPVLSFSNVIFFNFLLCVLLVRLLKSRYSRFRPGCYHSFFPFTHLTDNLRAFSIYPKLLSFQSVLFFIETSPVDFYHIFTLVQPLHYFLKKNIPKLGILTRLTMAQQLYEDKR